MTSALEPASRAPAVVDRAASSTVDYSDVPSIKRPVWTWEIPLYFFVGGVAGGAAMIVGVLGMIAGAGPGAAGSAVSADPALQLVIVTGYRIALAGAALSPLLLISDLGRPQRFLNMLRVLKLRSPMSVGVWVLVGFSAVVGLLWLTVEAGGWTASWYQQGLALAGVVLGALLSTYAGVLLAVTAVPVWHAHRRLLPLHFGLTSLGAASALLAFLTEMPEIVRLFTMVATVELTLVVWWGWRLVRQPEPALHSGLSGMLLAAGGLLVGPVAVVLVRLGDGGGGAFSQSAAAAAIAFILGAILLRFGWIEAGRSSALQPTAQNSGNH